MPLRGRRRYISASTIIFLNSSICVRAHLHIVAAAVTLHPDLPLWMHVWLAALSRLDSSFDIAP